MRGKIEQIKDWQDPDREENPTPCAEITIAEISPELYAKLLSEAIDAGAKFSGTNAEIEGAGFDCSYDAEWQTLHVTCLKKPFFISRDAVEQRIRELVLKSKH